MAAHIPVKTKQVSLNWKRCWHRVSDEAYLTFLKGAAAIVGSRGPLPREGDGLAQAREGDGLAQAREGDGLAHVEGDCTCSRAISITESLEAEMSKGEKFIFSKENLLGYAIDIKKLKIYCLRFMCPALLVPGFQAYAGVSKQGRRDAQLRSLEIFALCSAHFFLRSVPFS
jgi:hypothetical protein